MKRVTIKDIADEMGLSRNTVTKALMVRLYPNRQGRQWCRKRGRWDIQN